jgi:hypothetical protein
MITKTTSKPVESKMLGEWVNKIRPLLEPGEIIELAVREQTGKCKTIRTRNSFCD